MLMLFFSSPGFLSVLFDEPVYFSVSFSGCSSEFFLFVFHLPRSSVCGVRGGCWCDLFLV